ncbi:High mobility group nucleosome-binding domain-containing protein 5, partial [Ophiophagus hannah]
MEGRKESSKEGEREEGGKKGRGREGGDGKKGGKEGGRKERGRKEGREQGRRREGGREMKTRKGEPISESADKIQRANQVECKVPTWRGAAWLRNSGTGICRAQKNGLYFALIFLKYQRSAHWAEACHSESGTAEGLSDKGFLFWGGRRGKWALFACWDLTATPSVSLPVELTKAFLQRRATKMMIKGLETKTCEEQLQGLGLAGLEKKRTRRASTHCFLSHPQVLWKFKLSSLCEKLKEWKMLLVDFNSQNSPASHACFFFNLFNLLKWRETAEEEITRDGSPPVLKLTEFGDLCPKPFNLLCTLEKVQRRATRMIKGLETKT